MNIWKYVIKSGSGLIITKNFEIAEEKSKLGYIVFCKRAKKLDYKIYCDGTIACGHIGSFVVYPVNVDGRGEVRIEPV